MYFEMSGAVSARTARNTTIASPIRAALSFLKRVQKSCRGLFPAIGASIGASSVDSGATAVIRSQLLLAAGGGRSLVQQHPCRCPSDRNSDARAALKVSGAT